LNLFFSIRLTWKITSGLRKITGQCWDREVRGVRFEAVFFFV